MQKRIETIIQIVNNQCIPLNAPYTSTGLYFGTRAFMMLQAIR